MWVHKFASEIQKLTHYPVTKAITSFFFFYEILFSCSQHKLSNIPASTRHTNFKSYIFQLKTFSFKKKRASETKAYCKWQLIFRQLQISSTIQHLVHFFSFFLRMYISYPDNKEEKELLMNRTLYYNMSYDSNGIFSWFWPTLLSRHEGLVAL
jgi:hypothetical protein